MWFWIGHSIPLATRYGLTSAGTIPPGCDLSPLRRCVRRHHVCGRSSPPLHPAAGSPDSGPFGCHGQILGPALQSRAHPGLTGLRGFSFSGVGFCSRVLIDLDVCPLCFFQRLPLCALGALALRPVFPRMIPFTSLGDGALMKSAPCGKSFEAAHVATRSCVLFVGGATRLTACVTPLVTRSCTLSGATQGLGHLASPPWRQRESHNPSPFCPLVRRCLRRLSCMPPISRGH